MPRQPSKRGLERAHVRRRGRSVQVLVYAGSDPVTGKDVYLSESTTDERKVDEIRIRLLAKVDKQRNASTKASLGYVRESVSAWRVDDLALRSLLNRG